LWIGGISLKRLIGVFLIAFFLIILIVECIQFNIRGAKKIVEMKNISENISNQTKIMKIELNDDYDKNGQYLRGICGKVLEIRESEILVQYSKNDEITFTIKGVRLNLFKENLRIGDQIKITYLNTTGNLQIPNRIYLGEYGKVELLE
jgi:hypothetical protein